MFGSGLPPRRLSEPRCNGRLELESGRCSCAVLLSEPLSSSPSSRSAPAFPARAVKTSLAPERLAPLAGRWVLPKGGAITIAADGNALAVRADDPEAMSALAPPPAGQADRFAQLTTRTADISSRSFKGDVSGLHQAMGGDMPIEQIKTQEVAMMRDREGRLGRFVKSSALATVPREGDTVQTIVQLEFEKGSVFNIYVWGPRRLLGIRGTPQLSALRFLPVSDRSFAAYSPEMGDAGQILSFETAGGETVLVLPTAAGPVTARKGK